jgi:hypothetical protein
MVCTENVCIAASCEDAVQNQTETDIDCGGAACGASCEVGDKCTVHGDCQTGNCLSGSCRASSDLWCESRIPNVDKIVDNALRPQLKIVNTGTSDMPLSELTVRYWYTVDGIQSQNYTCSSATSSVGCSNILVGFSAFTPAVAGADAYVDFTFTSAAGVLSAGGSVAFQGIVRKTDFSDYDEADDFSYNPASDHVITTAVSLYRNGALVWGLEPKAIRAPEAAAGSIAGLDYRYFEGSFSLLPDFTQLTPVKTGAINNFLLSVANRSDNFALEYTGFLDVASDGVYRFSTTSDDGSRLMIGSSLVVWNDGLHVARETRGTIALKRGKHTINVAFFESSGTESLVVRWGEGAAVTLQAIPDGMLFR